ncbi:hypothetical protein Ndes2526B_g08323 [Nannochloris sp. 'desiccata']
MDLPKLEPPIRPPERAASAERGPPKATAAARASNAAAFASLEKQRRPDILCVLGSLPTALARNALVKNTGHIQRGVRRSSSAVVVASLPKHAKGSVAAAGVVLSSNAGVAHAEDGAMIDSAVSSIVEIVKSTGDAVKAGLGVAEQGLDTAKSAYQTISPAIQTANRRMLAETAVGLVAAYYLLPPVLKASVGALRGYAGDVSPAAALDALSTQGKANLVDIRTAREKEQQGLPDVPNSGKLVELEFATIEDRKVRGQLRDIGKLEIKITAMQIAALKRLNKGAPLYLMDKNGGGGQSCGQRAG